MHQYPAYSISCWSTTEPKKMKIPQRKPLRIFLLHFCITNRKKRDSTRHVFVLLPANIINLVVSSCLLHLEINYLCFYRSVGPHNVKVYKPIACKICNETMSNTLQITINYTHTSSDSRQLTLEGRIDVNEPAFRICMPC